MSFIFFYFKVLYSVMFLIFFLLSLRLNILLGGLTPLYFHIVNVCLHCAVTCLLMHTCHRCVFKDSRLAFITALLFAVHPVHTEAVSTVSLSNLNSVCVRACVSCVVPE